MKKRVFTVFLILLIFVSAASAQTDGGSSSLIVYFPVTKSKSLSGEVDSVTHASGNTQRMVTVIRDLTGADLFEIDLVSPYSSSYNTVLKEAKDDQKKRARPEIRNRVGDMDRYDTIFLGFPNWWATIPMPIATFLESYDLKGKKIIPFCTHGGGRLGQSVSAIAKITPGSRIMKPLEVYYSGGSSLNSDIRTWLTANGVTIK